MAQEVEILAGVLGRRVPYVETTPEEDAREALARGTDQANVEVIRNINEVLRANGAAVITDDVERVTGKLHASFEHWCRCNAAAFVW